MILYDIILYYVMLYYIILYIHVHIHVCKQEKPTKPNGSRKGNVFKEKQSQTNIDSKQLSLGMFFSTDCGRSVLLVAKGPHHFCRDVFLQFSGSCVAARIHPQWQAAELASCGSRSSSSSRVPARILWCC